MRSAPPKGRRTAPRSSRPTSSGCPFDSEPRTIIGSPSDGQAVMITDDGAGGDEVVLVDLPERTPAPDTQSATPDPTPTMPTAPSTAPTAPTATASAQRAARLGDAATVRRSLRVAIRIPGHRHERSVRPPRPRPRRRRASPRPRPWRSASPSPATSSSSANRPRSRRMAHGSRSRPGPATDRAARMSTSGASATRPPAPHGRWVDGLRVVGRRPDRREPPRPDHVDRRTGHAGHRPDRPGDRRGIAGR